MEDAGPNEDADVAEDTGSLEPPPIDLSACPEGVAPTLESCEAGLFDADCGGSGEPVLACGQTCKWFAGGCPAEGFRPIACPLGDPFCVATADGQWPYPEGLLEAVYPFHDHMCDQLDLLGDAVVTTTSGPFLELRVDPALTVPETPGLECDGVGLAICSWIMRGWTYGIGALDRQTFAFRQPSVVGEVLAFELLPDAAGAPAARAWLTQFTDHWPHGEDCTAYVAGFGTTIAPRPVLTGGELVLTAEPADGVELHGEATLVTAEGGTMTLRF